jgi:hypothetical protein
MSDSVLFGSNALTGLGPATVGMMSTRRALYPNAGSLLLWATSICICDGEEQWRDIGRVRFSECVTAPTFQGEVLLDPAGGAR